MSAATSAAPGAPIPAQAALVRRPSPRLAEGLTTHIERQSVDVDLAAEQWAGYVAAMRSHGWDIVEVDPADDCADGVFVEDTVVVMGRTAVLTRPGAPSRRAEVAGTGAALRARGYEVVELGAGTLDGGDVLQAGDRVYVGRGGRTDAAGVAALRSIAASLGRTVTPVPITRVLHLKSAVTALPDDSIIGYPPLVEDPAFFPHFRPMPEEGGSHVVDLGAGHLLMASSAPRSADLLADLGFIPVPVDISEFEKLEGCVTCLSVRLRTPR